MAKILFLKADPIIQKAKKRTGINRQDGNWAQQTNTQLVALNFNKVLFAVRHFNLRLITAKSKPHHLYNLKRRIDWLGEVWITLRPAERPTLPRSEKSSSGGQTGSTCWPGDRRKSTRPWGPKRDGEADCFNSGKFNWSAVSFC